MLFLSAPEEPEEKDDSMAPTIVQKPKAKVVDEGETVTFECTFTCKPEATVSSIH